MGPAMNEAQSGMQPPVLPSHCACSPAADLTKRLMNVILSRSEEFSDY